MSGIKRALRSFSAAVICLGLILSTFTFGSAAVKVSIWDGTTELQAGRTYYMIDTVKIRKAIVIPEGTKLSVRDGAYLGILPSGRITVNGELSVAVGGTIKNSGVLNIKKTGILSIYGTLQSSLNGTMNISGNANVYNRGVYETSSATKIYKDALITSKGRISFYKSSDVKMSGTITTYENSDLELRGIMAVSVSGVIDVSGHLTVGNASNVRCSGMLTLESTATFTRFKPVSITKSGKFVDNRPRYIYEDMTVDILIDEPDTALYGIDVSYAQGEIDWEQVAAAGVDFAIVRAGRGRAGANNEMKEDEFFERNITEAQKYGIDVGVYFFSYATSVSEAREEARFFVDIIKDHKIQYPVILDMEESFQGDIGKKKLTNMIDAFFEILMENNFFPMFYSYKTWIETYLDMTTLDKYAVWLAQISDEVTYDGGYYIWQYSFTGKVSGINSDVDLNVSYKNWPEILKKHGLNNLSRYTD